MKLDIASGARKQEGYTGIDIMPGSDIVHNLSIFPWPVESDSVEEAVCQHFIEHIPMAYWNEGNEYTHIMRDVKSVDAFFKFWQEVYRILKVGSKITVISPYYSSVRCWQDPTHRRALNENTFLYLNKGWITTNLLTHYNTGVDFDFGYGYGLDQYWQLKNEETRNHALKHNNNVAGDIHLVLTKRPPEVLVPEVLPKEESAQVPV